MLLKPWPPPGYASELEVLTGDFIGSTRALAQELIDNGRGLMLAGGYNQKHHVKIWLSHIPVHCFIALNAQKSMPIRRSLMQMSHNMISCY